MWQFVGFYGYFFSSHSNICTDGPVRQRVALRYSLELLLCLKKKSLILIINLDTYVSRFIDIVYVFMGQSTIIH